MFEKNKKEDKKKDNQKNQKEKDKNNKNQKASWVDKLEFFDAIFDDE